MSFRSIGMKYLLIPAWILILAIVVLGVVQSGKPGNLVDPAGFLFVLVGGIALVMISFSGAEIQRALRDAVGAEGTVLFPTFTGSRADAPERPPSFDRQQSRSYTGALGEYARSQQGAVPQAFQYLSGHVQHDLLVVDHQHGLGSGGPPR